METECKEADFKQFVAGFVALVKNAPSNSPRHFASNVDKIWRRMAALLFMFCFIKCKCFQLPDPDKYDPYTGEGLGTPFKPWAVYYEILSQADQFGLLNETSIRFTAERVKDKQGQERTLA